MLIIWTEVSWSIWQTQQYKAEYLMLGRNRPYFVKYHSDSIKKFSETNIFNMLEFLIDNIFAMLGGRAFEQTVGIPMCTNCIPLLADLYMWYS
jgi:hypothetical protein